MTQAPPSPPLLPGLVPVRRGPAVPGWDLLARNRHVTVPLAVPPAFLAAGAALAGSPQAGIPTAVGAGVLAASVWWASPHKWTGKDGKPRWPEVWYARTSALAAGAWLSVTAFTGLGMWQAIALGPLGLAWGIPWWQHKRARKHSAAIVEQWARWWLYYARNWDLHGSSVLDVTTRGVIDTLHVQLHAGHQTLADVKGILPKLESALQGHVALGMTRAETPKGRPDQALIHLKRENPHDVEVEWDAALAPSSVTGLMPVGRDEGGEWVRVPMLGNWFIIGKTRSGKSNELSCFLAAITGCPDALTWLVDLKGGRSARPWAGAVDWVATTIDEARLMLAAGVAEVRARALHVYDGNEQLAPTGDVPALFVTVDEAHGVLSDMSGDTQCRRDAAIIASEGSAVNVHLIVLSQYGALHESVGSEQIRGNLSGRLCFAVADPAHGQFALTDYMNLDASRLDNKGEFYWRLGSDQPSAPARGPHMPHPLVRQIAARNAAIPRQPLMLLAADWQQVYDGRRDRLPLPLRSTPPEVPMTTVPPPWQEALDRIEDEVASVPDLPYPPPVDDEALRRSLEGKTRLWAALLQQAPPAGVRPSQLESGSGMGHTWTQGKLKALVAAGVVTKITTGRYAPRPGQDIWAGLQAIEDGLNRLAELART